MPELIIKIEHLEGGSVILSTCRKTDRSTIGYQACMDSRGLDGLSDAIEQAQAFILKNIPAESPA